MNKKVFLSIAAPAYNEENNIERVIKYWNEVLMEKNINGEIVITNDGSTDQTRMILTNLQKELDNLIVVNFKKNMGYGMALVSSIKASSGSYILTLDSDGQFDAKEYYVLYNKLMKENLDLVTGFRKKKQDNFFKTIGDRIFNILVKSTFHLKLRDTNCAMKLAKGDILRNINIESKGFSAPTEILLKMNVLGMKVGEEGISHYKREKGMSKLKFLSTSLKMIMFLIYLKLKIILYRKQILSNI